MDETSPSSGLLPQTTAPPAPYTTPLLDVTTEVSMRVAAACEWLVARYDSDAVPDLVGVRTTETDSGFVELLVLSGADEYRKPPRSAITRVPARAAASYRWVFGRAPMNEAGPAGEGDALMAIKTDDPTTGTVRVDVYSGPDRNQHLAELSTPLGVEHAKGVKWVVADYNGDGVADLFCIHVADNPSSPAHVDVLDGKEYFQSLLAEGLSTPVSGSGNANYAWGAGSYDLGRGPDLFVVRTSGAQTVDVDVLDVATKYSARLIQAPTIIKVADAAGYQWGVADYDGDGISDLLCIRLTGGAEAKMKVTVLDGRHAEKKPPPVTLLVSPSTSRPLEKVSFTVNLPKTAKGSVAIYEDRPGNEPDVGHGMANASNGYAVIDNTRPFEAGLYALRAYYGGDRDYTQGFSPVVNYDVKKAQPSVSLSPPTKIGPRGTSIVWTVTVPPWATGTVTILDADSLGHGYAEIKNTSGTITFPNTAEFLTPGPNQVYASYSGDKVYEPAKSPMITIQIPT